jgi:hypothetical protein
MHMNIKTGKFDDKTNFKKKAVHHKGNISVMELEKPYLKLVYFNPYLSVRKY